MVNHLKKIHIISVAFERHGELKVFVQSWLNQTEENWFLTIIHDGPNEEFLKIMKQFKNYKPNNIDYYCTKTRHNDYGHSLREEGLKNIKGDFVLLSNCDNYFVPKTLKYLNEPLNHYGDNVDVVLFNMVHSHSGKKFLSYSPLKTEYKRNFIDISAAIVKKELAEKVGFRDKSFAGDATYFEDIYKIKKEKTKVIKVNRILLVHN